MTEIDFWFVTRRKRTRLHKKRFPTQLLGCRAGGILESYLFALAMQTETRATPCRSVAVALKTMAGEVQNDEHQHQHTDHGEEDLDS